MISTSVHLTPQHRDTTMRLHQLDSHTYRSNNDGHILEFDLDGGSEVIIHMNQHVLVELYRYLTSYIYQGGGSLECITFEDYSKVGDPEYQQPLDRVLDRTVYELVVGMSSFITTRREEDDNATDPS